MSNALGHLHNLDSLHRSDHFLDLDQYDVELIYCVNDESLFDLAPSKTVDHLRDLDQQMYETIYHVRVYRRLHFLLLTRSLLEVNISDVAGYLVYAGEVC